MISTEDLSSEELTPHEKLIVRLLRTRVWTVTALLDELSKGRKDPMTDNSLKVAVHTLRKKGIPVRTLVVYCLGEPKFGDYYYMHQQDEEEWVEVARHTRTSKVKWDGVNIAVRRKPLGSRNAATVFMLWVDIGGAVLEKLGWDNQQMCLKWSRVKPLLRIEISPEGHGNSYELRPIKDTGNCRISTLAFPEFLTLEPIYSRPTSYSVERKSTTGALMVDLPEQFYTKRTE